MKKFIKGAALTGLTAMALPQIVMAQTTAFSILAVFENILRILPRLLIALGFVYFLWGVIQYISAKDADAKEAGKKVLVQGVMGLLIALSVWGLIGIVQSTLGFGAGGSAEELVPSVLG